MPDTHERYLSGLPASRRARIDEIIDWVAAISPDATASMKYKMPTFETPDGYLAVGNQKHHISVYTCSAEKIAAYVKLHPKTDHGKGCLRFRDSTPIDPDAMAAVIRNALL